MSTKKAAKNKGTKGSVKKATPKAPAKAKSSTKAKLSALDAAAQVLAAGGSMSTAELIEAMAAKKLWQSPNGKTPAATLYAALLREITTKGVDSRFQKTEPGRFAAANKATMPTASEPKPAPKSKTKGGKKAAEPAPAVALPNEATLSAGAPELAGT